MNSQSSALHPFEITDAPELVVRTDRRGEVLSGWAVAATLLVLLAVF